MAIFNTDQNSNKGAVEKQEYAAEEIHAGHGLTATNVCTHYHGHK